MSADVHLEEKVDDSLIGGFVFELDGLRLDASVERQLERLRSQLVEKNNRIV
jgi:F-type H+-transporting ATPase subunit delta